MTEPATVVRRIFEKRDLLARNDPAHSAIKTALVIGGGGMRGVYGGGAVIALRKLGLTDAFDHLIGVSAGAADCAYFLSDQPEIGTSLYYEEFSGNRFINPRRLSKVLDIDFLADNLRHTKALNQERIRAARSQLWIGVTDADTGCCDLLDAKDPAVDLVTAVAASCAIPGLYNKKIAIKGTDYSDGGVACGLPIHHAVEVLQCTDILIILNSPYVKFKASPGRLERLLVSAMCRQFPKRFRTAIFNRNADYNRAIAMIDGLEGQPGAPNIGIIAPGPLPIERLTRDAAVLRQVAEVGARDVMTFFGNPADVDITYAN